MTTLSNVARLSLLAAILAVFSAALVPPTSVAAKPRPTVSTADECFQDGGASQYYASGGDLISYCCYDDGCWICSAYQDENGDEVTNLDDCVWDGKGGSTSMPVRRYPIPTVGANKGGTVTGTRIGVIPIPPIGVENPGTTHPPGGAPPTGTPPPRGTGTPPVVAPQLPPVSTTPPPRRTVGIAPVPVVGAKQPGSGGSPVTIFKGGRGRGVRSSINAVPVLATKQPGGAGQPVTIFARGEGHAGKR